MASQTTTLLEAADEIVRISQLPCGNDHDAVVEIVARMLGAYDPKDAHILFDEAFNPTAAAEIVYAALEAEASDDEATVRSCALPTSAAASNAVKEVHPGTPPLYSLTAMLTLIKEVLLPLAEHVVELEDCLAKKNGSRAHIIRLEDSVRALSGT